jgi:hypothetical protein
MIDPINKHLPTLHLKRILSIFLALAALGLVPFAVFTVQTARADQAPAIARIHNLEPYELSMGTFIGVALESVDPSFVSGMVYRDVYDHFNNIAIHKGSRLFGHQVKIVNGRRDVLWTEIQLTSTGQTYALQQPLPATSPLGARGLTEFQPAAIAGTISSYDLSLPH